MLIFNSKENEQRWFEESPNDKKGTIVLNGDNVEFGGKSLWISKNETIQASDEPSPSKIVRKFFVLKAWSGGLKLREKRIKKLTFNQKILDNKIKV